MKDVLLAATILLGACSTVVPGTVLKLSEVDPLTADPADIALQVEVPDSLGLLPEAGTLALSAQFRDDTVKAGQFPIEQVGDVLQIAPASHAALRALQAEIAVWETADPDGTDGSLGVDLEPCLRAPRVPADATVSVGIRLEADGAFLPLLRDAPLAEALETATFDDMPMCP